MFQIATVILIVFTAVLAVVAAVKKASIDQRIKFSSVRISLTALAVVCQFANLILDGSHWDVDIILMVICIMYMVVQVLNLQSLVDDKVRGERVD